MDKLQKYLSVALIAFILGVVCSYIPRERTTNTPILVTDYQIDTIQVHDTIFQRYDKYIYKRDTIIDSVLVPIYKHHFDTIIEEFQVNGIIEGWHAQLDSLHFVIPKTKNYHWSVGPQLGVGYNGKITPYIGIGVSYNLFKF